MTKARDESTYVPIVMHVIVNSDEDERFLYKAIRGCGNGTFVQFVQMSVSWERELALPAMNQLGFNTQEHNNDTRQTT